MATVLAKQNNMLVMDKRSEEGDAHQIGNTINVTTMIGNTMQQTHDSLMGVRKKSEINNSNNNKEEEKEASDISDEETTFKDANCEEDESEDECKSTMTLETIEAHATHIQEELKRSQERSSAAIAMFRAERSKNRTPPKPPKSDHKPPRPTQVSNALPTKDAALAIISELASASNSGVNVLKPNASLDDQLKQAYEALVRSKEDFDRRNSVLETMYLKERRAHADAKQEMEAMRMELSMLRVIISEQDNHGGGNGMDTSLQSNPSVSSRRATINGSSGNSVCTQSTFKTTGTLSSITGIINMATGKTNEDRKKWKDEKKKIFKQQRLFLQEFHVLCDKVEDCGECCDHVPRGTLKKVKGQLARIMESGREEEEEKTEREESEFDNDSSEMEEDTLSSSLRSNNSMRSKNSAVRRNHSGNAKALMTASWDKLAKIDETKLEKAKQPGSRFANLSESKAEQKLKGKKSQFVAAQSGVYCLIDQGAENGEADAFKTPTKPTAVPPPASVAHMRKSPPKPNEIQRTNSAMKGSKLTASPTDVRKFPVDGDTLLGTKTPEATPTQQSESQSPHQTPLVQSVRRRQSAGGMVQTSTAQMRRASLDNHMSPRNEAAPTRGQSLGESDPTNGIPSQRGSEMGMKMPERKTSFTGPSASNQPTARQLMPPSPPRGRMMDESGRSGKHSIQAPRQPTSDAVSAASFHTAAENEESLQKRIKSIPPAHLDAAERKAERKAKKEGALTDARAAVKHARKQSKRGKKFRREKDVSDDMSEVSGLSNVSSLHDGYGEIKSSLRPRSDGGGMNVFDLTPKRRGLLKNPFRRKSTANDSKPIPEQIIEELPSKYRAPPRAKSSRNAEAAAKDMQQQEQKLPPPLQPMADDSERAEVQEHAQPGNINRRYSTSDIAAMRVQERLTAVQVQPRVQRAKKSKRKTNMREAAKAALAYEEQANAEGYFKEQLLQKRSQAPSFEAPSFQEAEQGTAEKGDDESSAAEF